MTKGSEVLPLRVVKPIVSGSWAELNSADKTNVIDRANDKNAKRRLMF
jgi:hypothetical protein